MSRTWFPDLIGPTTVAANAGTPVSIRGRSLNLVSGGVALADNPSTRRTDLTIADSEWVTTVFSTTSTHGEWLPASASFILANLIRLASNVTDTVLVGLTSSPTYPTQLVKYVANTGTNSIALAAPGSPAGDFQYFAPGTSFSLGSNATVRVVWDSVSLVYRIHSVAASHYIVVDGNRIVVDGNPILNPE